MKTKDYLIDGAKLKTLRESKGFSQRELADKCNLDHSTIGKYELGKNTQRCVNIIRVAEELGVDVSVLIKEED